jgi:hypothetical protein
MQKTLILMLALCLCIAVNPVLAKGKIDLSGDWMLDRDKTESVGNQIFLAAIAVVQKQDSLLTVRTYENEYGEQYPFDEPLTLDGREHKITVYDMPRTTKAMWAEDGNSIVIISTTVYYGDSGTVEFHVSEKWYLAEEGALLCNEFTSKWGEQEQTRTFFFRKK